MTPLRREQSIGVALVVKSSPDGYTSEQAASLAINPASSRKCSTTRCATSAGLAAARSAEHDGVNPSVPATNGRSLVAAKARQGRLIVRRRTGTFPISSECEEYGGHDMPQVVFKAAGRA